MIPILQFRKHKQRVTSTGQLTAEQGLEPRQSGSSSCSVHHAVLPHTGMWVKHRSQLSSSLFCLSPKDSTGEPLHNLSNPIQINQEVKRNNTWAQVKSARGSEGVQRITTPGEQTRWQHPILPMLGSPPSAAHVQAQRLGWPKYVHTKGDSFPSPKKFR